MQEVKRNLLCKPCEFPKDFEINNYQVFQGLPQKILYSGDLIYNGCLDAFYPTTDPQQFWKSVRKIQKLEVKRILPGHHQLCIPVEIISIIEGGFSKLADKGKLKQGNNIFDFGDFQIHI